MGGHCVCPQQRSSCSPHGRRQSRHVDASIHECECSSPRCCHGTECPSIPAGCSAVRHSNWWTLWVHTCSFHLNFSARTGFRCNSSCSCFFFCSAFAFGTLAKCTHAHFRLDSAH